MHAAPSIVVFTVLSGLGFGLIAWLGLGATTSTGWVAAGYCASALLLVALGLFASLLHLGQPLRFLKAFSQWRSSWLSREAVLAIATIAGFTLHAALWTLAGLRIAALGALCAALALATVAATAMIYGQMRTVPRWRSPFTPLIFLLFSLTGGALFAGAVASHWLLAGLGLAQLADWLLGDRRFGAAGSTLATATGLGPLGRLRLLEPPHSGPNYLTREMVYVLARRHARKLRLIGLGLAVLVPLVLLTFVPAGPLATGLAVLAHGAGALIIRWLFFAQAEHVVGLYYGKH